MERNDFLSISQKSLHDSRIFRLFFIDLFIYSLFLLIIMAFMGYFNNISFYDIITFRKYSWWLFYVVIFSLASSFSFRQILLVIEPFDKIDVNKLLVYFEEKYIRVDNNDVNCIRLAHRSGFKRFVSVGLEDVEISWTINTLNIKLPSRMAYNLSHDFRWEKIFLKD